MIKVIIGLVLALALTQSGRKLAAHVVLGGMQSIMCYLPFQSRLRIVQGLFMVPIPKGRRRLERFRSAYGYQWDSIVKVSDRDDGVRGHWFIPNVHKQGGLPWAEKTANGTDLIIMYFHGGGYSLGHSLMNTTAYLHMIERLQIVHGVQARIFGVDYGMFPDVQWPAPLDDCEKAYSYMVRDLKVDPSKIIIGGDSAGGHLASTLLLRIKDQLHRQTMKRDDSTRSMKQHADPLPMPKGAIMVSPWVDVTSNAPTYTTNANKDCLIIPPNQNYAYWFVPDVAHKSPKEQEALAMDPNLSPVFGDYNGVCPMIVTYGGHELFAYDIEQFIKRLKEYHVDVNVVTRADAVHIWALERFVTQNQQIWLEGINKVIDWCAATIRQKQ